MTPAEIFFTSYLEEAKLEAMRRLEIPLEDLDSKKLLGQAMTGKLVKKSLIKDEEDLSFPTINHYYFNSLKISSYLKKFLPVFKKFLRSSYID